MKPKPTGFVAIGVFLFFGAAMASLAATTLLWRGTVLDRVWTLNQAAYRQLSPLRTKVGLLFVLLSAALLTSGIGWFRHRRWGWRLAVAIIAIQVLGDIFNIVRGDLLHGATGVIIAGALLLYLLSPRIRAAFSGFADPLAIDPRRRTLAYTVSMTPRIKNCVERASYYRNEILQEISKHKTADNSDRSRVATAFISMAAGDFKAILTEVDNENNTPALKLFRFLYEDVINGLWVQAFAKDDLIKELLHGKNGKLPGYMADRAKELDKIFVPPPTVQPAETLFVDIQGKLWTAACSYAHGGSLAINRELAGHDEQSIYEMLRTSTTLFVMVMNGMYELHHDSKQNPVLRGIAQNYFDEKW